jgi:hypothetical protein
MDAKTEKTKREAYLHVVLKKMERGVHWRSIIRSMPIKQIIDDEIRTLCRDVYWGKGGIMAQTAIDSMTSFLSKTGLPEHQISWGNTPYEFWDNVRSARLEFVVKSFMWIEYFFFKCS